MFVDDMVLYVTNSMDSLCSIENVLETFQVVSGLKVNKDKLVLYPIALDQHNKQVKEYWKYLGVKMSVDFTKFSKLNLEKIDSSMQNTVWKWNNKLLSWFERI